MSVFGDSLGEVHHDIVAQHAILWLAIYRLRIVVFPELFQVIDDLRIFEVRVERCDDVRVQDEQVFRDAWVALPFREAEDGDLFLVRIHHVDHWKDLAQ